MVSAVELSNVYKKVGGETVLENVSLTVSKGEVAVVRGRSGVGKTTLAKIVALIIKPDRGYVGLFGENMASAGENVRALFRLKRIGYVDQFYSLIPELTVLENIELPLMLQGVSKLERERKAYEIMGKLGIKELGERYPGSLSGGEKQRVAIARALVKKPDVFVGDEPFSNLDDETVEEVFNVIMDEVRSRGMVALITTTSFELKIRSNKEYLLKKRKLFKLK